MSFSEYLATKCLSLNDESCMVRLTHIDLNTAELKYYPFMISLDKSNGSFNVLSLKICVPTKAKDINVFNMIAKTMKLKQWQNIFHVIVNANSITYNLNQKWKKIIAIARKIVVGILAHVFVRIAIISDCVWSNYICYGFCINKKEKYCSNGFFSDTIIVLSIILLLTITIICYHYAKHRSKQKGIDALTI